MAFKTPKYRRLHRRLTQIPGNVSKESVITLCENIIVHEKRSWVVIGRENEGREKRFCPLRGKNAIGKCTYFLLLDYAAIYFSPACTIDKSYITLLHHTVIHTCNKWTCTWCLSPGCSLLYTINWIARKLSRRIFLYFYDNAKYLVSHQRNNCFKCISYLKF